MQEWSVAVDNASFDEAGITKDAQGAVIEYIWNGLEASANEISVAIFGEDLSIAPEIVIKDNGTGIDHSTLRTSFGAFLSSPKRSSHIRIKTQQNKGKGRFSYMAIASSATWNTTYWDGHSLQKYSIHLNSLDKASVKESELISVESGHTGTEVVIPIADAKTLSALALLCIRKKLLEAFAWYLYLNQERNITIDYEGEKLDYNEYVNDELSREETIVIENYSFQVNVIVWNSRIDNSSKIYYLDIGRHIVDAENTSFNKNAAEFHHSVYVVSSYFDDCASVPRSDDAALIEFKPDQRNVLSKLRKKIKQLVDATLREHLLKKADAFLTDQEAKNNMPIFDSTDMGQIRRTDFINVTREMYCAEPRIFFKLKDRQSKTILGFIALLLDSNERENLLSVMEQIVELTPEQRSKFVDVLKKTRLENIVNIMEMLQNRYDVVRTLKAIVYDMAKFANERDHIQRIVEEHYWLFGDQYSLVSADVQIKRSLIEFEKYVSEPRTETVLNVDELRQRMDIVLYGSRITEDDRNEGLIVELKAPSVKLSVEVLQQIERYANIVRKEPRFSGNSRVWKFYAICSSVDEEVTSRYEGYSNHGKQGLVSMIGNFEIYALSWDDIFLSFERRYRFLIEKIKRDYSDYCDRNSTDEHIDRSFVDRITEEIIDGKRKVSG